MSGGGGGEGACVQLELMHNTIYYSTTMSFYHIWTREHAKYESVLHCSKRITL